MGKPKMAAKRKYRDPMPAIQARARAMKAAGRQPTGYLTQCDDIYCTACTKARNEKAPWNR